MKYLFLLCYYMILGGATISKIVEVLNKVENLNPVFQDALNMVVDPNAFLEDLEELRKGPKDLLTSNPDIYFAQLVKEPYFDALVEDHIHDDNMQFYHRIQRVKAFMRACGIKQKYDYTYSQLKDMYGSTWDIAADVQILMTLLGINCPDYKYYFFTSKGDLLDNHAFPRTQVFRDLWELLDHYGIEYKQRGPKFNSQTLNATVNLRNGVGQLDILDILITTEDGSNDSELEVISLNNPQCARFVKKLIQTRLREEWKIMQEHNVHKIYISHSSHIRRIGSSNRTAIAWGVHAAVHGLETPATVFTGSIDRNSGKIEQIGGMDAKHAEAESVGLPMIVPQENLYKNNGKQYNNVKPVRSLEELFKTASRVDTLNRPRPHLDKSRYTVKPVNTSFARLLHKLP